MANDKLELPEAPWGEFQKEQGAAGGRAGQEAGEQAFLEMSAGGNATQEAPWVQWPQRFPSHPSRESPAGHGTVGQRRRISGTRKWRPGLSMALPGSRGRQRVGDPDFSELGSQQEPMDRGAGGHSIH